MLFKTITNGNNIIYTIMARLCLFTYHKSDFRRIPIVFKLCFHVTEKELYYMR